MLNFGLTHKSDVTALREGGTEIMSRVVESGLKKKKQLMSKME